MAKAYPKPFTIMLYTNSNIKTKKFINFSTISILEMKKMVQEEGGVEGLRILNLTQHNATPEQLAAGVFEPKQKEFVKKLLTFDEIPTRDELMKRAITLSAVAWESKADGALIGGAPYLTGFLERELKRTGIKPVYAFTKREVLEFPQPDGSVKKVAVFRHLGFVEV